MERVRRVWCKEQEEETQKLNESRAVDPVTQDPRAAVQRGTDVRPRATSMPVRRITTNPVHPQGGSPTGVRVDNHRIVTGAEVVVEGGNGSARCGDDVRMKSMQVLASQRGEGDGNVWWKGFDGVNRVSNFWCLPEDVKCILLEYSVITLFYLVMNLNSSSRRTTTTPRQC